MQKLYWVFASSCYLEWSGVVLAYSVLGEGSVHSATGTHRRGVQFVAQHEVALLVGKPGVESGQRSEGPAHKVYATLGVSTALVLKDLIHLNQ